MTCSSCELSLYRTLASLSAVENIQVSLILARATFDIDLSQKSVDQVIAHIQRTTDFTCERIATKARQIDVLHPNGAKALLRQQLPCGVDLIRSRSKGSQIVSIQYNPELIGARDIVGTSFDQPLQLASEKDSKSFSGGLKEIRKDSLMTLISCLLTIPVLILAWAPLPKHAVAYGAVSLALATIIQVVVTGPFYMVAFKKLFFSGLLEVEFLIVLSTTAAYVFSVVAFAFEVKGEPLRTGEFFETSTLLVTLIMIGRLISSWSRQRAAESISLRTLQTSKALLLQPESKSEYEIDARLLHYGDVFVCKPETRLVTDGIVISGTSEVDESMMTGESKPVTKEVGTAVMAGSMNGGGLLHVRVSRLPGDNTITTIADMVDEAKMAKAKSQDIADRVAGYFVPVVLLITTVTFIGWISFDVARRDYSPSYAAEDAVIYAMAVLIVSCPCAIGLCVPMVIVIAGGVAAKHGVIFKTGHSIEIARNVNHVVFDKTGTLTTGTLSVVSEDLPCGKEHTKSLILGLVAHSKHPVSAAVAKHLKDRGTLQQDLDEVTSIPGKGMEGIIGTRRISAGNSRWLGLEQHREVRNVLSNGLTTFCVMLDSDLVAVFGLKDTVREDSRSIVLELEKRRISISIVSGDDQVAVEDIAINLGIPLSHVRARCSPQDKVGYLKDIMQDKHAVVMFCGDGTNDAPALAQAHIGIHINEGSEVAQSAADAVLIRPALRGILCFMDLSREAVRRIKFNFCWSFIYNLFAVLLAAGLFVKWHLPPQYAALGELVSVLPVIGIALHLRLVKLNGYEN
ncbi:copper-translocating P-type ATPase [Exophiala spinifera]|uniref:Copper-translocating P-type ATPase n=1 Tax=Exophiala spinifera TaxID=91928 RepID=A0A0D2B8A9_9EURO|nr:copper-translocating P-type ATPase [Exophiala spinifera]KIW14905.1 copper-translocating P-type ATPase [Exophiala spinifera]